MNNFPFPWWDKTLTIYNKFIDPTTQRVSWYRTVVENCFWKYVQGTYTIGHAGISSAGVILETKDVICRIPASEQYVEKSVWKSLEDKTDHFTLANGDIIILGEVDDTIDDYAEGQRSTDLITKYKAEGECLVIDTFVNNVQSGVGLAHYRVVGK